MQIHRIVAALALLVAPVAHAVDWSDPQSLVTLAQTNAPDLARMRADVTSARERVIPAAARPNPMIMGGVENKQVDFTNDDMMTMYVVGASQTFVSRDKRDARRSAAELNVEAIERQLASAQIELEREVLFAWYDVATIDAQIRTIEGVRHLIDAIVDAARVRYEVGSASQSDVIRGQLEKSTLDHELIALRGNRRSAATRLLAATGLPLDTVVPTLTIAHPSTAVDTSAMAKIDGSHPAIAALQAEVDAQEQQIALARLATRPDITVEAEYGVRRTQKDMFSVIASVELPWRDKRTEPRIREAVAVREASQRRIDELRRTLVRDMGIAAAAHDTTLEQMRFHEQVLVPQARLALDSTLAAYQTGRIALDAVLGAESTYLRLQLDHTNYLAEHIKAVRDFDALRRGARFGALVTPPTPMASVGGMQP